MSVQCPISLKNADYLNISFHVVYARLGNRGLFPRRDFFFYCHCVRIITEIHTASCPVSNGEIFLR
jgi:hypothetical protein